MPWSELLISGPFITEVRVRFLAKLYGMCGRQTGNRTGFHAATSDFPYQYHPTIALYINTLRTGEADLRF